MLTLITVIPSFVLSSSLVELRYMSDGQTTFTLSVGNDVILQETYIPDDSNEVVIRSLYELLQPFLEKTPSLEFSFRIENNTDAPIFGTTRVQRCDLDCTLAAEELVNNYFLSALSGRDKITSLDHKEYLTLCNAPDANSYTRYFTIEACSLNLATNKLFYWEDGLFNAGHNKETTQIDVSPAKYVREGFILLRYDVLCEGRKQSYRLDLDIPESFGVIFRNSFGAMESFYFTGTSTIEPSITRSSSFINGLYTTYKVEENRVYKVNTGYLLESMLDLADDLVRSKEVYLIDGEKLTPIIITESDTSQNNDDDTLYNFSISYRIASKHQAQFKPKVRVFDETFDETYN